MITFTHFVVSGILAADEVHFYKLKMSLTGVIMFLCYCHRSVVRNQQPVCW